MAMTTEEVDKLIKGYKRKIKNLAKQCRNVEQKKDRKKLSAWGYWELGYLRAQITVYDIVIGHLKNYLDN